MVQQSFQQYRALNPPVRRASWFVRWGPTLILVVLGFYSADTQMFMFGTAVFLFFYTFFFNIQVPPVMMFLFFFQWFFNMGQLIYGVSGGYPLSKSFDPGDTIETVYYLGMIGTAMFFLGVLVFYRRIKVYSFEAFRQAALQFNVQKLLVVFLATYPVLGAALSAVWLFPGLTQPLVMLLYFKWSLFFLLFICVFMHNKYKPVLFAIIMFEFLMGFASFWATFKDVVYVSFIAYWILYFKGNVIVRWTLPAIILLMVYIGSIWSVIKQDYRAFLNGGRGVQGSVVSRSEALNKFSDMVVSAEAKDIEQGFDALILRMSWIGAFNKVYNHVPSKVPHQDGALWSSGVARPFTPRLFFPGKTSLSDSEELNYYSGLHVEEENTSISLSTIAGSYVDYGAYWMHLPLLLFGLFFGWIYRKIFDMAGNFLMAHALSVPLIFLVNINEQSINRMVSSLVLYFLVVWFICKFLQRPFIRIVAATPIK